MTKDELSKPLDPKQSEGAKNANKASITNALLIGFMFGIIIYSVTVNSVGFFTLIPLFIIYLLVKGPKKNKN